MRVEADGVEHGGVEWVAHRHLQAAVTERGGKHRMLESDLGGNAVARLGWHGHLGQVQVRPIQRLGQLLQEGLLSQPALTANKGQQRLLRAAIGGHPPGLVPLLELLGSGQLHPSQKLFQ